ncbi:MAG: hypothetical protein JJT77_11400 [Crocinitomicaceae bacterium]|nr:hypothetical protein [Crocinitomicaceae bacterium]
MKHFLSLLLIVNLISCEQPSIDSQSEKSTIIQNDVYKSTDKYIQEIDENLDKFQKIESLSWHKIVDDKNIMLEVEAYIDEFGSILKLAEKYNNETIQELGAKEFYLKHDALVATKHTTDNLLEDGSYQARRITTYYEDGEPLLSYIQQASFIEELTETDKKELKNTVSLSIQESLDALNNEGAFTTYYLSYVESGNSIFLVLGEPKPVNRFSATVLVKEVTPFIQQLIDNPEKYQYQKVNIVYRSIGGNGQPRFKLLEEIKFAE